MSWLNRLTKGVEEAASRATSEADKAIKLTKVNNEINGKKGEIDRTFSAIGQSCFEMYQSGVALPDSLGGQFRSIESLIGQVKELEAQRDAIKSSAVPADCAPSATPSFCSACGAGLPAGSAHCPNCGQKVV